MRKYTNTFNKYVVFCQIVTSAHTSHNFILLFPLEHAVDLMLTYFYCFVFPLGTANHCMNHVLNYEPSHTDINFVSLDNDTSDVLQTESISHLYKLF